MPRIRRLFWDLETSPNIGFFWRSGRKISVDYHNIIFERKIICACYKWEGKKKVHTIKWDWHDDRDALDQGDDRGLCERLAPVLASADEIVAHNGDRFDIRWFNGRYLVHGLPPISESKTVDTLKLARRYFDFNCHRLDYLGQILLGKRKIHTNFNLWRRIVLANDPKAMARMTRYCRRDVILVEQLYNKCMDFARPETHAGVFATGDPRMRWTCPHCASTNVYMNKTRPTKAGMVRHEMMCKDCKKYYSIPRNMYIAYNNWQLEQKLNST